MVTITRGRSTQYTLMWSWPCSLLEAWNIQTWSPLLCRPAASNRKRTTILRKASVAPKPSLFRMVA